MLAWLLVAPPFSGSRSDAWHCAGCGDPGHLNDGASLSTWRRFGSFDDAAACARMRQHRIGTAPNDEQWADYRLSRCVTAERARGGPLTADERASD